MIKGFNKIIIYIVILAVVSAGVWYFENHRWDSSQTNIFMGRIVGFDRNYILMRGLPNVAGAASQYPQGLGVVVTLTSDTKIVKYSGLFKLHSVSGKIPSEEDIKRDEKSVLVEEFKKDVFSHELMIRVTASENIVGKQYFTASEIDYALDNRLNLIR